VKENLEVLIIGRDSSSSDQMLKYHSSASQCRGARASYEATRMNSDVASLEVSESREVMEIMEEEEEELEEDEEEEAIVGRCGICWCG
jgi:hypothetical protein